jgi:hypothetical protein
MSRLGLKSRLESLRPRLASVAQAVINEWEQDEDGIDEKFGAGGPCDTIANEMASVLAQSGIDVTEGGHDGDDHAYLIAYDDDEAFVVDIPPGAYETGGGYRWRKLPNVRLQEDDVVVERISRSDIDPDMHENQRARKHTPNARGALEPGQRLETRGVLAGRYRGKDISERALLTHTVVVGADDRDVRVLCGFRVEGMADSYSAPAELNDPPTCARCLARWVMLRERTGDSRIPTEYDGDIPSEYYGTKPRGHKPNRSAVYYVWVLDYRGVPLDEGPYGPHAMASAESFARIGAQNGEHDRAVSIGKDPEASDFEIVRHYRRGTGERLR